MLGQSKPQVCHILTSKLTLLQVDLDVVFRQAPQKLVQLVQVGLVVGGVEQQIVDVDDDVVEASDHGLHEALKRGRRAQETHRGGDPFELSLARHREGGVRPGLGLEKKLPEASGEIDGCEDRAA